MSFDLETFRALYPQFDCETDSAVMANASMANCHNSIHCDNECNDNAIMLLVAHLLAVGRGDGRVVSSVTEGDISVTFAQQEAGDNRKAWLALTPYGTQYLALESRCNKSKAAAGLYFGNLPEQAAIRKFRGIM